MRRPLLALCIALLVPVSALAEAWHLVDEKQLGGGYWVNQVKGRIWGWTTGSGTFDTVRADMLSAGYSHPFTVTNLDMSFGQFVADTYANGPFSYDGTYFPAGSTATFTVTLFELIWRIPVLDRPHVRLSLMPGARVAMTRAILTTQTQYLRSENQFVLPEIGTVLEALVHARTIVYGLIKYMDTTGKRSGTYTLELEGGLSYLLPAPNDRYIGWRVTSGVRYLALEATERVGRQNQVGFDLECAGPFLEVTRTF